MKSAAVFVLLAAMTFVTPGFADETYFIEVGNEMPRSDALKGWQTLAFKHKNLLGKLKVYPKAVMKNGVENAVRIQAGPIADKAKAQRICNRLFADDTSCFVIEGMGDVPPGAIISFGENTLEPSVLPWLQGKVEVAEAIRVPLTGNSMTVEAPPPVTIQPLTGETVKTAGAEESGWLVVAPFTDEENATVFWQRVRHNAPEKTMGMNERITRSIGRGGVTQLTIGPFASGGEALTLCRDSVAAIDPTLRCRFDAGEPVATLSDIASLRGDSYGVRRRTMMARRDGANTQTAPLVAGKAFWVQLISAPSEMEALTQWEEVRTRNADLLEGKRSNVSVSISDKTRYVMRVGPLADSAGATGLCNALHNRGIECRVLILSNDW